MVVNVLLCLFNDLFVIYKSLKAVIHRKIFRKSLKKFLLLKKEDSVIIYIIYTPYVIHTCSDILHDLVKKVYCDCNFCIYLFSNFAKNLKVCCVCLWG